MIRVFKKEGNDNDEIRIIDTEIGTFKYYLVDKNIGFPYGFYETNVFDMGYISAKECIKVLKGRKQLGNEVEYNKQRELERLGYINLGIFRLKREGNIEDICNKLMTYGMSLYNAHKCITETYLNNKEVTQL
jgi:hypothetical protein